MADTIDALFLFGQIALRRRYVTYEQFEAARAKLTEPRCPHPYSPQGLAELLIAEKILTAERAEEVLKEQATRPPSARLTEPPDVAIARRDPQNVVDRYVLTVRAGQGGMSEVFKAWDVPLSRYVAVKFLLFTQPEDILRFRLEAQTIAQLHHPNIISIYEIGEHRGRLYIVMPWIEGTDLGDARLPLRRRIEALRDAARGAHYAHLQGVLHRDLKPDNILLTDAGEAFVSDFGLAKIVKEGMRITMTGTTLGTPAFVAPEQVSLGPDVQIDARADVYALGSTLYLVLTGHPPYEGGDPMQVLIQKMRDDPPAPSKVARGVPRGLDTICMKAMERAPQRRYASAEALAADLDRWLKDEPIEARPINAATVTWRRIRRWRVSAVGAVLLAAAAVVGVTLFVKSRIAPAARGLEPEWHQAFEDAFDRDAPGPLWRSVLRGDVAIHDGELCLRSGHVVFEPELHEDVRLEFDARVMPDAERPVEVSAFTNGSLEKGLTDGYSFEFGILDGGDNLIQRSREVVSRKAGRRLSRGRPYAIACVSFGGTLRLFIDGEEEIELVDPHHLQGPQHRRVGFGSKCDHLHISRVQIFLTKIAAGAARTSIARVFVDAGRPDEADAYLGQLWDQKEPEISEPATMAAAELKYRIHVLRESPGEAMDFMIRIHGRLNPSSKDARAAAERCVDESCAILLGGIQESDAPIEIENLKKRIESARGPPRDSAVRLLAALAVRFGRREWLDPDAGSDERIALGILEGNDAYFGGTDPATRGFVLYALGKTDHAEAEHGRARLYAEAARNKSRALFDEAEAIKPADFATWPLVRSVAQRALAGN